MSERMEHPSRIGKYEVEQFLGGGMARVYRAKDSILGRHVALKLLAGAVADIEAKAHFLQEARLASSIAHENIIAVYDFGEDQGRPFMIMELLEGESLRDAIRGKRTGDIARKLRIALQVARALGFIHAKKIVHRDIKPENIHIDSVGRAKLMDFGIAQVEGANLSADGSTRGTPFYMSPEQVLGKEVTAQSDVYSFGVLTYELFSGVKPVQGTTVEQLFEQILHVKPNLEPLHEAQVPPAAMDLVVKCLAKQPAERPPGFEIICGALEEILGPGAIRLKPLPQPAPSAASPARKQPTVSLRSKLPASLQSQWGIALLAALAAIAFIIMAYFIFALRH
jgi:eukaryotic-like serine/threonine-protein kinase